MKEQTPDTMISLARTTGRILFAVPFGGFGVLHLLRSEMFTGMVPAFIPGGVFWVYLLGLAFIAAAAALVSGRFVKQAAVSIAIALLLFITTLWIPRLVSPASASVGPTLAGLFKDFGLLGGALVIAGQSESRN